MAGEKKLAVEIFHCALCPEKIDHLWFPEIGAGVITSTPPHQYPAAQNARVLNLETLREHNGNDSEVRTVLDGLLEKAVAWLREAKSVHDGLEDCYRPYMDFQALNLTKKESSPKSSPTPKAAEKHRPAFGKIKGYSLYGKYILIYTLLKNTERRRRDWQGFTQ